LIEHICPECNSEKKPVALIFGDVPGWACECQWSTMTKEEYREMFGLRFVRVPVDTVLHGGKYSGNSRNRRRKRRAAIRTLKSITEGGYID
jgi:hypothetical protein